MQVNPPNLPLFKLGTVAVHRRLHRHRAGAGFCAERHRRLDLQHGGDDHAAGVPRGVDRQPRREAAVDADWTQLHAAALRRSTAAEHGPGEEVADLPERLRGLRGTRTSIPRGSRAGSSSARRKTRSRSTRTFAARLCGVCEKHHRYAGSARVPDDDSQPAAGTVAPRSPVPGAAVYAGSEPPLTVIDVTVPRLSSASRTVYVTLQRSACAA